MPIVLKKSHKNQLSGSGLRQTDLDRLNEDVFLTQERTRSPISPTARSRAEIHALDLGTDFRLLVEGTGSYGLALGCSRYMIASSPKTYITDGDFGACLANADLTWLLDSLSYWNLPRNTKRLISNIKFNFSLNVSQLADVLRVARPTVYAWLDEEEGVRIHPQNQRRVEELAAYADIWWRKAEKQLPKELLDSKMGSLFLDQLKEEVLNDQLLRWLIDRLYRQLPVETPLVMIEGVGPAPDNESSVGFFE